MDLLTSVTSGPLILWLFTMLVTFQGYIVYNININIYTTTVCTHIYVFCLKYPYL